MTADELWRAVGEELLLHRSRKSWNLIDVQRAGGPTYATVELIEQGQIGNLDSLTKHVEALGLTLVDVLRSVLATPVTMSAEAAFLLRVFDEDLRENVTARQALLAVARAFQEGRALPPTPPPAPTASGEHTPP